ncbi:MAG: hypothetical protein AAF703_01695 [Cyanobacteria bacterium P01_D01_bin.105]
MSYSLFRKLTPTMAIRKVMTHLCISTLFGFTLLAISTSAQDKQVPLAAIHSSLTHTSVRSSSAASGSIPALEQHTPEQHTPEQHVIERHTTDELLPLTARKVEVSGGAVILDQISDEFNAQMESQWQADTTEGFPLESLPVIGELLDESGNLDMGINLPVDMRIGDVMGETGLVLSADFTVN